MIKRFFICLALVLFLPLIHCIHASGGAPMKMSYPYQTEVLLLLYSPFQQLDIYDTVGEEKKVVATICPVRDSFEMESHILLMKVLDNRDGMLRAVVMMDNLMLEEDEKEYAKYEEKCELWKDTSYVGWIDKDNLGVSLCQMTITSLSCTML